MPQVSSNLTDALRVWFRECPILTAGAKFGVNYLAERPTEYAIYATPSTIRYRENVLGEEVPADEQTQNFIFASKEAYGADTSTNISAMSFYEAVTVWIQTQNAARNFPRFAGGTVKSIIPTLTAYPAEIGADSAKYQIQLKVTYRR